MVSITVVGAAASAPEAVIPATLIAEKPVCRIDRQVIRCSSVRSNRAINVEQITTRDRTLGNKVTSVPQEPVTFTVSAMVTVAPGTAPKTGQIQNICVRSTCIHKLIIRLKRCGVPVMVWGLHSDEIGGEFLKKAIGIKALVTVAQPHL